jgi:hypothetical protein
MEARAAATPIAVSSAETIDQVAAAPMAGRRRGPAASRAPVVRAKVLTHGEEYAYIRADMRRLIVIASALFVLMVVLLFVID